MLDFPGGVVAPDATPNETKVSSRPFEFVGPSFASWNDQAGIHVPSVGNVEADGTETGPLRGFFGNDVTCA